MKIKKYLMNQLKEIDYYLKKNDKQLAKFQDTDDYKVWVSSVRGISDYFYIDERGARKHIPASERDYAKLLVQKAYHKKLQAKLLRQKRLISKFLSNYEQYPVVDLYENLCKGRRELIKPLVLSDEEFISKWMEQHEGEQNSFPSNVTVKTNRGELVRSKSEKILADLFYKYDIPYQYEPRLAINEGRKIFPDFAVLNVHNRKTYYWEHFGMASDEEYSTKNLAKLMEYEKEGFEEGDNLIVSFETLESPIDISIIKRKIKRYLIQ